jgi:hypothetical protein
MNDLDLDMAAISYRVDAVWDKTPEGGNFWCSISANLEGYRYSVWWEIKPGTNYDYNIDN